MISADRRKEDRRKEQKATLIVSTAATNPHRTVLSWKTTKLVVSL